VNSAQLTGLLRAIGMAAGLSSLPYFAHLAGLLTYFTSDRVAIVFFLGLSLALGVASAYLTDARAFACVVGGILGFTVGIGALHAWAGLGNGGHGDMFFVIAIPGIVLFCVGAAMSAVTLRRSRYGTRR